MRIAVAGPGAIGGLIAMRLKDAGHEVSLLTRGRKRIETLAVGRRRIKGWARPSKNLDAVILSVKAPAIHDALKAIRPMAGKDTTIISLLNGVAHIGPVRRAFGRRRTVFGSCYIASMRKADGTIVHSGGEYILLAKSDSNREAHKKSVSLLSDWKIKTVNSEERLLWTKLVYNAAVNPLGALLDRTNGELASDPALRELVRVVLKEAVAISTRAGFRPLHADLEKRIARGCLAVPNQINSMAQDLRAGRETEADAILKPLIDAAKRQGRSAPAIEPLYRVLKRLESSSA